MYLLRVPVYSTGYMYCTVQGTVYVQYVRFIRVFSKGKINWNWNTCSYTTPLRGTYTHIHTYTHSCTMHHHRYVCMACVSVCTTCNVCMYIMYVMYVCHMFTSTSMYEGVQNISVLHLWYLGTTLLLQAWYQIINVYRSNKTPEKTTYCFAWYPQGWYMGCWDSAQRIS